MFRAFSALLILTALQACNAEPIPSITTPPLVSFAPLGRIQAVLIVGRDGAAPPFAEVEVQNESSGARVAIRAGAGGDFSAQLDATVGDALRVVRLDGRAVVDLARASSPDASAATVAEPGSAAGTSVTLLKESGDFRIVGSAGSVPGGALVVVSPVGAAIVAEVIADAAGAFSISLDKDRLEGGAGDDAEFVGVVAFVGGNVSPALLLATEDDSADDGSGDSTDGRDGGAADDATDGTDDSTGATDDGTDTTDDGTEDGTGATDDGTDDGAADGTGGTDEITEPVDDGTTATDGEADVGTDSTDDATDTEIDSTDGETDSTDDATDSGTDSTDDGT